MRVRRITLAQEKCQISAFNRVFLFAQSIPPMWRDVMKITSMTDSVPHCTSRVVKRVYEIHRVHEIHGQISCIETRARWFSKSKSMQVPCWISRWILPAD